MKHTVNFAFYPCLIPAFESMGDVPFVLWIPKRKITLPVSVFTIALHSFNLCPSNSDPKRVPRQDMYIFTKRHVQEFFGSGVLTDSQKLGMNKLVEWIYKSRYVHAVEYDPAVRINTTIWINHNINPKKPDTRNAYYITHLYMNFKCTYPVSEIRSRLSCEENSDWEEEGGVFQNSSKFCFFIWVQVTQLVHGYKNSQSCMYP